jgi:uncharacterized protein (PEP-CTERM system associated)
MADRSTRGARLPGLALLPLLIGLAFAPCSHAEIKVVPGVSVTETWTDNVNLTPSNQARSEFVTDLAPSLSLVDNNPRLQLAASYQFHQFLYSDRDAPDLHDNSRNLQAALKAKVIEDLLFLDADATRSQQAVSAFGPQVADNLYSANNRSEVSLWRVSPYLVRRIGSSADLVMRYTRDSVRTSVTGYGNTQGEDANLTLSSRGDQRIGWTLQYDRQHLTDRLAGDSTSSTSNAGLSWQVQPGFSLTGSAGYDDYDYHSLGGRTRGRSWNVGYAYKPSSRTSLSMSFGRRYFGASRSMAAMHRSRHTVWNFSYDESVTTSREQFLLPAAADTVSLLDQLFTTSFPDPVLRRQAVDTYIKMAGLPSSLATNVNYLSNRYMLQKQFQASVAMIGARSTLLLSANDTRRNALSVQETDSQLLGSSLSNLNDNTRVRTLSADFSYRMSSRTDAVAMANISRSVSLETSVRQNNRGLRLALRHQFQRKLQGSIEVRHLQGSNGGSYSNQSYTENAISATLTSTF